MDKEFKEVYIRCSGKLYTFILWLTQNRTASEEILQDVFVNAWKSGSMPGEEEQQLPWFYRVARNATVDYFRKSNRFSNLRNAYGLEQRNAPVKAQAQEEQFSWNWVDELAYTEKTILYLNLRDGYTYKEIARMINLSESNVRVKAFRALKKIRENFNKKKAE